MVGNATQGITSSASGNTVDFTISDASTSQKGVSQLATAVQTGQLSSTTLTITPAGLGPILISEFVVGPGGAYTTVQSGINAAHTAGGGTVYVKPGTYTENLTLFSGVDLFGAIGISDTGACTIIGVHTPPTSGSFTIRNILLQSATDIISSVSAGSTSIVLIDCAVTVTNGYTFNLLNWTGSLTAFDIGEIGSTSDGWINNTGGATVFMTNATIGAGTANSMVTSGSVELYNCVVNCPINFATGTNALIAGGCLFQKTVTFSNNSIANVYNSSFSTGSTAAISYGSTGAVSLSNVTLNSSNNPCIAGSGAGTLTLGSVTYLSNSTYAVTLTVAKSVVQTGNAYLNNISFDNGTTLLNTNGKIWIGSSGGNPAPANITSTGSTVTITNGPHSINLETAAAVPTSFATDSGTAVPALGVLTITGSNGITTSGSGSTVTINLTVPISLANGGTNANLTASNGGIFYSTATAGAILSGTATANQILISGASTTPAWTTSTIPSTNAQGDILYGSTANVWSSLAKNASSSRYLSNSGTSNNPAWAQVDLTNGVTGLLPVANGGTGVGSITAHYLIVGNGTSAVTLLAPSATSGVPLISKGASSDPAYGTAVVAGGGTGVATFTAYGPVVAGSTTTAALSSVSPSATSGIPFISQGSSANPAFGTAVVGGGGTGNTTFTAYSVICAGTTATGAFQNVSGVGTSGQRLTSNGASALPTWQTDTQGNTWTDQGTSITVTSNVNYFATAAITLTLPASPSQGDTIIFYVDNAGALQVSANTGQTIRISTGTSTSAGSATSTARGDSLTLTYRTSDTVWTARAVMGNWTLA